jgi:hypothetical protein
MIINNNNQYSQNIILSVSYFLHHDRRMCVCVRAVQCIGTSRKLGFRLLFNNHIPIFVVHWSTIRWRAVNRTGQTQILYNARGTYTVYVHTHTHMYI